MDGQEGAAICLGKFVSWGVGDGRAWIGWWPKDMDTLTGHLSPLTSVLNTNQPTQKSQGPDYRDGHWVKCLPGKQEELSSFPSTCVKCWR